ncbi:CYFA0S11e02652g1_1 [Cyberlindnera fabianii]|uniref:CYFA0S11e02652g1_1 n=1 Tax=Cyberlindnera fabianii TaxID=36022 RepID=A0A061B0B7_CYBFA|nr:CYFA0S11e02652g1_1 [Cyberlindnera fabianii]
MFGLGKLFYVIILLVNAIAILNEERFLKRIGLHGETAVPAFGQPETSAKSKVINLISSVQTVMRIPLIAVNVVIIVYELLLG